MSFSHYQYTLFISWMNIKPKKNRSGSSCNVFWNEFIFPWIHFRCKSLHWFWCIYYIQRPPLTHLDEVQVPVYCTWFNVQCFSNFILSDTTYTYNYNKMSGFIWILELQKSKWSVLTLKRKEIVVPSSLK